MLALFGAWWHKEAQQLIYLDAFLDFNTFSI